MVQFVAVVDGSVCCCYYFEYYSLGERKPVEGLTEGVADTEQLNNSNNCIDNRLKGRLSV